MRENKLFTEAISREHQNKITHTLEAQGVDNILWSNDGKILSLQYQTNNDSKMMRLIHSTITAIIKKNNFSSTFKSIAACLLFLICFKSNAQTSVGLGAGLSPKSIVAQLSINYENELIGIDLGMSALLSSPEPVYFTTQVQKSANIGKFRVTPMAGIAYRLQSTDNKSLNGWTGICSIELSTIIEGKAKGILYTRISYTNNTPFLVIGLRGLIY